MVSDDMHEHLKGFCTALLHVVDCLLLVSLNKRKFSCKTCKVFTQQVCHMAMAICYGLLFVCVFAHLACSYVVCMMILQTVTQRLRVCLHVSGASHVLVCQSVRVCADHWCICACQFKHVYLCKEANAHRCVF